MDQLKPLKKIKSGLFDRSMMITKIALQSSSSLALGKIKGLWSDADSRELQFKVLLEAQGKLLAQELGQFKGSMMKVGQMLALYGEHFLPEELVRSLKTLNEQSPSVAWPMIEALIREHLGTELMAELEIDTTPLAAASMGQVHKAIIKATGECICLKVQYPGVEKAIDSDIKAMRSILSMLKFIPKQNQGYQELFDEIRNMLNQELNYEQELAFTDAARELLKDRPEFIIPLCFPRYSRRRILATSFEPGFNLDSTEVQSLSAERKNRLGHNFSWLFVQELFHFRMMQTDPHFGNYKIRLDAQNGDQIVLLDWGAVRSFPADFIGNYLELLKGAIEQNHERMIAAALKLGFVYAEDGPELSLRFAELCSTATEPWLAPSDARVPANLVDGKGCYLWSKSDLPTRMAQMATRYTLSMRLRPPPAQVLFLNRKIGGVFIILKILDARIQGNKLLDQWLFGRA